MLFYNISCKSKIVLHYVDAQKCIEPIPFKWIFTLYIRSLHQFINMEMDWVWLFKVPKAVSKNDSVEPPSGRDQQSSG